MKYFVIILFIFFVGCQNKSPQKESTENSNEIPEIVSDLQETQLPTNEPEPVIIDSTYLINTGSGDFYGWSSLRYEPNDKSVEGSLINLGGKLYVIEDKGDWLKVWSKVRVDRAGNFLSYNNEYYGSLYIKKELTGKFEELLLTEEDLPVVANYAGNNKRSISEDTLSFQLITKEIYLTQKEIAFYHIIYDTLNIKKIAGELTLPCTEQTVVLTDIDNDSDYMREYIYIGEIPLTNAYLIKGNYFESGDYFCIDKQSGEQTMSFEDFPAFSSDGKYIVSIWGNPYESHTEFTLYEITADNTQKELFSYIFKKWMPFNCARGKEIDYFWGYENQLYVKIQTARLAGQIHEDYAVQYMKVKIGIIDTE